MYLHELVLWTFLPLLCRAQLPIPPHKLGFEYQQNTHDAPVQVDMFIDVVRRESPGESPTFLHLINIIPSSVLIVKLHIPF